MNNKRKKKEMILILFLNQIWIFFFIPNYEFVDLSQV